MTGNASWRSWGLSWVLRNEGEDEGTAGAKTRRSEPAQTLQGAASSSWITQMGHDSEAGLWADTRWESVLGSLGFVLYVTWYYWRVLGKNVMEPVWCFTGTSGDFLIWHDFEGGTKPEPCRPGRRLVDFSRLNRRIIKILLVKEADFGEWSDVGSQGNWEI